MNEPRTGFQVSEDSRYPPVDLNSFETFMAHPLMREFVDKYERDVTLAREALVRIDTDLKALNAEYYHANGRVLFTVGEPRIKSKDSFFRKLHHKAIGQSARNGLSSDVLASLYNGIHDIAGIRFACPYFDEVEWAANEYLRPKLKALNYAVNLTEEGLTDRNYLNDGDESGYRSYHFLVKVPTTVDIWGRTDLCLVEVQGRSELQHVWAVKSHDLLYKNELEYDPIAPAVLEDMRQLSNSLRSADHFLTRVRDAVRGGAER